MGVTVEDFSNDVSFPIAAMIDIDRAWQQNLLALRREVDRLDLLDRVLNLALEHKGEDQED